MFTRWRMALLSRFWSVLTLIAARRRATETPERVQRQVYRGQTRGMGVRINERLRDRLRPRWLRLHRNQPEQPGE